MGANPVSYTHLRAHETVLDLVCRLLLEKKNKQKTTTHNTHTTHTHTHKKKKKHKVTTIYYERQKGDRYNALISCV